MLFNNLQQLISVMVSFMAKIFNLILPVGTNISFGYVLLYFAFAGILVNFIFGITSSSGVKGAISAGSDFVKNRRKK